MPLIQIPKLSESFCNSTRYWFHLEMNDNELEHYQVSIMYNPMISGSLWHSHASLVHVPLPHRAVLNIRPQTLNYQLSSPRASANVLSDALMHPPRCDFFSGCNSAIFMTRNISRIHCDCWIGHHAGTHINSYSACPHRLSLKFLVFQMLRVLCSRCRFTSTRILAIHATLLNQYGGS